MAKEAKTTVTITIPNIEPDAVGYERDLMQQGLVNLNDSGQLHMNVKLGRHDAVRFLRLRAFLRSSRSTLSDGRPVHNNNDVLRWLCQNLNYDNAA